MFQTTNQMTFFDSLVNRVINDTQLQAYGSINFKNVPRGVCLYLAKNKHLHLYIYRVICIFTCISIFIFICVNIVLE